MRGLGGLGAGPAVTVRLCPAGWRRRGGAEDVHGGDRAAHPPARQRDQGSAARPGRGAGSLRRPERGGERALAAEGGMRGRGAPGEPGPAPAAPSLALQPPAHVGGPVSPQPGLSVSLL